MKKILLSIIAFVSFLIPAAVFAVQVSVPSAPINGYSLISSTTGNYLATTTGLVTCSGSASCGVGSYVFGNPLTISATGGSGGVGNWFTPTLNYNSTSTVIGFLAGLFSTGSTTIGILHLPLSNGELAINGNTAYTTATTTFSSPLNYANGAVSLGTVGIANGGTATTTNGVTNGVVTFNGTNYTNNSGFITNGAATAANTTIAIGKTASNSTRASLYVDGSTVTNGLSVEGASAGNTVFSTFVTGDSQLRFSFLDTGVLKWTSGAASPDIQLSRSGAGGLAIQGLNSTNATNGFSVLQAAGANVFDVDTTDGFVGVATSTPYAPLSVVGSGGVVADHYTATSTTATSTLAYGLNINGGCFAVNSTCLTAGAIGGGATEAANWATTGVLSGTPTYSNGTAGVGATLTEVGTGALSVDSNAPAVGDRVLVKNQASAFQNGIFVVTVAGSGIASYVLTRSSDYNTPTEITPGINTYVLSGTANSDTTWAVSYTPPLVIGTNNLTYTESAAGGGVSSLVATYPLSVSGSTGAITISTVATSTFASSSPSTGGWGFTLSNNAFTLTLPSAGASTPLGLLSAADWNTFNGKGNGTAGDPFTHTTYNGVVVSATTTGIWDTAVRGFMASSSVLTYASTTAITVSTTASTTNLIVSSIGNAVSGCLQASATGLISQTGSACAANISAGDGLIFSGNTLNSAFNYAAGVLTTNSDLGAAISKFGIASSTPFSQLSVGTGIASSSISVAEYKYGATSNVATSTTQNVDCNAANQIAEPIGFSATTLTLINMIPGKSCKVVIQNPNGTAGAITWAFPANSIIHWAGGGTVPTQTTSANAMDTWSFIESVGSSTKQIIGAMTPW